jgi:hypothetical protein
VESLLISDFIVNMVWEVFVELSEGDEKIGRALLFDFEIAEEDDIDLRL